MNSQRWLIVALITSLCGCFSQLAIAQERLQDPYRRYLLKKYYFTRFRISKLYRQYGYTFYNLEKRYGYPVIRVIENIPINSLFVLYGEPSPFPTLKQKFPLLDAVKITSLLLVKNTRFQECRRQARKLLAKTPHQKYNIGFYGPDSPLQYLLTRHREVLTMLERLWEPSKKQLWLKRLMSLDEQQLAEIRQCPLALPYLLTTGKKGFTALARNGADFLYFVTLLQSSQWASFTERVLANDKDFVQALKFYGLPLFYYWERNATLVNNLLPVFHEDSQKISGLQKTILFLYTNRDTIKRYRKDSDFLLKLTDVLHFFHRIPISGSHLTLADRSLIDKNLFRLAYEYPELSSAPLKQFADYRDSLGDLFYNGVLQDHIAIILEAMNQKPYAEMIYRGLIKYHDNMRFREIIGRFGIHGMMVAINQDPNKYWYEIIEEGYVYLDKYEILAGGTIRNVNRTKRKQISVSLVEELLGVPVPLDLGNLVARLYQGYYVDIYDYLLAGADLAKFTAAMIEFISTGQSENSTSIAEWVEYEITKQIAENAKKFLYKTVKKLAKEGKNVDQQLYSMYMLNCRLNLWLSTENGNNTLNDHKLHIANFVEKYGSSWRPAEFKADMELARRSMQRIVYWRSLPGELQNYTFAQYNGDITGAMSSTALSKLTHYMLQNLKDTWIPME